MEVLYDDIWYLIIKKMTYQSLCNFFCSSIRARKSIEHVFKEYNLRNNLLMKQGFIMNVIFQYTFQSTFTQTSSRECYEDISTIFSEFTYRSIHIAHYYSHEDKDHYLNVNIKDVELTYDDFDPDEVEYDCITKTIDKAYDHLFLDQNFIKHENYYLRKI